MPSLKVGVSQPIAYAVLVEAAVWLVALASEA